MKELPKAAWPATRFPGLWSSFVVGALALLPAGLPTWASAAGATSPATQAATAKTAPAGQQPAAPPGNQPAEVEGRTEAPTMDWKGKKIIDNQPLPSGRSENPDEFDAYCQALIAAHYTPEAAFARSARTDLAYVNVYSDPNLYRGEVVRFKGQLRRLTRLDAPEFTWSQGVRAIYEGWMFDPDIYGANPMCVIFTDLPPGLVPAQKMQRLVTFDGYFFKKYRYKAADGYDHIVPLLIGHGPVPAPEAAPESTWGSRFSRFFVWAFVSVLVGVILVVGGLTFWYRRGDIRHRSRLGVRPPPTFLEPDQASPPPGPTEEPGPTEPHPADDQPGPPAGPAV